MTMQKCIFDVNLKQSSVESAYNGKEKSNIFHIGNKRESISIILVIY